LRWNNVDLGSVPPVDFIPVAEETGLILPIGEWVLRTACTQAKAWHDEGLLTGVVAVNVSNVQLAQPDFPALVATVLRETGLPPALLELEITESLVMQDESHAGPILAELKRIGVSLAIDDFGMGYSNSSAYASCRSIDSRSIARLFIAFKAIRMTACSYPPSSRWRSARLAGPSLETPDPVHCAILMMVDTSTRSSVSL